MKKILFIILIIQLLFFGTYASAQYWALWRLGAGSTIFTSIPNLNLDLGLGNLDTTGTGTFGELQVDNVNINAGTYTTNVPMIFNSTSEDMTFTAGSGVFTLLGDSTIDILSAGVVNIDGDGGINLTTEGEDIVLNTVDANVSIVGTFIVGGNTIDLSDVTDEYVLAFDTPTQTWRGVVSVAGAGYTNLTQFVDQTAWRLFYSNASGDVTELALGTSGQYLKSAGTTSAPGWDTPSGAGDVLSVGDCTDGACLDGTSDGGTYIRIYDGDSHYAELNPLNITANRIFALPDIAGTLVTTAGAGADVDLGDSYSMKAGSFVATTTGGWEIYDKVYFYSDVIDQFAIGKASDNIAAILDLSLVTTADKTFQFPNRSGTFSVSGDTFTGDVTATLDSDGSSVLTISANAVDGTHIEIGGDAQGELLYYDGSNYQNLSVGTDGQQLETNGANANPSWEWPSRILEARKGSVGTIAKGCPVYLSAWNASGFAEVEVADADVSGSMPAVGLAREDLTNSSTKTVLVIGALIGSAAENLDTSSFSVGDFLYVDTDGDSTTTFPGCINAAAPTTEANQIQKIGEVVRSHASLGVIIVFGAGRANATDNLDSAAIFVGNSSNVAVAVDMSGDITISNTGVTAIGANLIDFADIKYDNTLGGNIALSVDECFFIAISTGGGFICEGSTANTNEQLYLFPDVDGADTTFRIVVDATQVTDIEGTGLSIGSGTLNWSASGIAGHDAFTDFVGNEHIDWTSASDNLTTTGMITADTFTDGTLTIAGGNLDTTGTITLSDWIIFAADAFPTGRRVRVANQTNSNTAGNALIVQSGEGLGTGAGGNLTVVAGSGGDTGAGGDVYWQAGDGGVTSGNAGNVTIVSGWANAGDSDGGDINLNPGDATGSGTVGRVYINDPVSSLNAIFDTASIASANKTFTFPNITGTLVTTAGALANIDIGAYNFNVGGLLEVDSGGGDYFAITNMTQGDILLVDSAGNLNATFVGALTGNADTATALASNPTDCGSNTWATAIVANGNLTCSAITYAGISSMTSANWRGVINDEVGSGYAVFNASPNFAGSIGINDTGPDSALEVVSAGDDYFMISSYAGGDGNILLVDSIGAITFNNAYTFPTVRGNNGEVLVTDGFGNLSWSAAGAGDVLSVGDCLTGACFDGSSNGGTYLDFYDAQGTVRLIVGDVAGAITLTLPITTGTLIHSGVSTLSSLTSIGTIGTGTWEGTPIAAGYFAAGSIDGDDINSNIAGRSLTLTSASPDTLDADAELYTHIATLVLENPVVGDDALIQHKFPSAVTITRISASTDTGIVYFQLDERAEATPNSAGTDVLSSSLAADSNTEASTSFANAGIAADVPLSLDVDTVSGSPTVLRIHIDYFFAD